MWPLGSLAHRLKDEDRSPPFANLAELPHAATGAGEEIAGLVVDHALGLEVAAKHGLDVSHDLTLRPRLLDVDVLRRDQHADDLLGEGGDLGSV